MPSYSLYREPVADQLDALEAALPTTYQALSELDQPDGYPSLDGDGWLSARAWAPAGEEQIGEVWADGSGTQRSGQGALSRDGGVSSSSNTADAEGRWRSCTVGAGASGGTAAGGWTSAAVNARLDWLRRFSVTMRVDEGGPAAGSQRLFFGLAAAEPTWSTPANAFATDYAAVTLLDGDTNFTLRSRTGSGTVQEAVLSLAFAVGTVYRVSLWVDGADLIADVNGVQTSLSTWPSATNLRWCAMGRCNGSAANQVLLLRGASFRLRYP